MFETLKTSFFLRVKKKNVFSKGFAKVNNFFFRIDQLKPKIVVRRFYEKYNTINFFGKIILADLVLYIKDISSAKLKIYDKLKIIHEIFLKITLFITDCLFSGTMLDKIIPI